jgi:flagellar basal-body rod protein FlgC
MIDGISNALSGLVAASHRVNASANNIANIDSRGAIPSGGPTGPGEGARQAYEPVRVEQTTDAQGGTVARERYQKPSYKPNFDATSRLAEDPGPAAPPKVDIAKELTEQQSASQDFAASQRSVQSMSALVRKLYDLDQ